LLLPTRRPYGISLSSLSKLFNPPPLKLDDEGGEGIGDFLPNSIEPIPPNISNGFLLLLPLEVLVVLPVNGGGGGDDDVGGGDDEEEEDDDDIAPLRFDFDAFDSIVGNDDFEEEESSFFTIVGTTGEDDDEEIEVVTEDDGC
jgi:hypothetical protein